MKHPWLIAGAALAAVMGVGAVWYFSRRSASPGGAGAVAAGNKAMPGQPGAGKGSNAWDFGSALVAAGANAFGAYEKSNSGQANA